MDGDGCVIQPTAISSQAQYHGASGTNPLIHLTDTQAYIRSNLVPSVDSFPLSRKYPGYDWSRVW